MDLARVVLEGARLLLLVMLHILLHILLDDVHRRFERWIEHLLLLCSHLTDRLHSSRNLDWHEVDLNLWLLVDQVRLGRQLL